MNWTELMLLLQIFRFHYVFLLLLFYVRLRVCHHHLCNQEYTYSNAYDGGCEWDRTNKAKSNHVKCKVTRSKLWSFSFSANLLSRAFDFPDFSHCHHHYMGQFSMCCFVALLCLTHFFYGGGRRRKGMEKKNGKSVLLVLLTIRTVEHCANTPFKLHFPFFSLSLSFLIYFVRTAVTSS